MEGAHIFYVGGTADLVFTSSTPLTLADFSLFYLVEEQPALLLSQFHEPFVNLKDTVLHIGADSFAPIEITFDSNLTTAAEVVAFINSYEGVAASGGFQAVDHNGFIVIETLSKGGLSTIESYAVNSPLGFAVDMGAGMVQQSFPVDADMQLYTVSPGIYGMSIPIGEEFEAQETYFVVANVSPPLVQSFMVKNNTDFVSVNFVS